ncbi:DNA repair exonuclease SbcCD ATPase subunit [Catalinimonas alkaloidigena]|uniref:chromosome segregation protein SMC n=1 Tax=Catalinimonas alkaloidigena TaxID=1075417 RepID=UPI002404C5EC|nr:chromosome segregation protein SMC [Catalinimonas alkaloidigena]MDF9796723.1 DNA repair exonuclease SbcCD ATPase subunit [Catalinimonas alkaloidigena]
MSTNQTEQQRSKNRTILITVIGLLLLVNVVTLFLYYQNNQEMGTELQSSKEELEETYNKLESMSNELNLKIEELQKLGEDVEELRLIRETLEQEKEQLQNEGQLAQKRYDQIRNRVEGYRELLIKKDAEIAELKELNEALYAENTELKEDQRVLNKTISEVKTNNEQLSEKVEVASMLKAENISVMGINGRGNAKERDRYRNNQIEQLQLKFNLAKNDVAPVEGKDIMVRVIDPDGNVIFDVAKGAGTFMKDGKEVFFTQKQEILFDNTQQELTFLYEKGSDYAEGRHTIEIYTDDYIIGKTNFEIR